MRIGLCQVDGKWPNLALMKLSTWHKAQGHGVERYIQLGKYDLVYASKVFSFTPDDPYLPANTVRGGTGYDVHSVLPAGAEACRPDYSLYPGFDKAIGFTTRGCVRRCPFCVVPQKEGKLRVVGDLYSFWDGQKDVILLDNNLTAAPRGHFEKLMAQLIRERVRVDFSQGLDLRLLTDSHAELLAKVRMHKRLHFAWDFRADEDAVLRGLEIMLRYLHPDRITVYLLSGYNTGLDDALYRVNVLLGYKVNPFIMRYDRENKMLGHLARYCNKPEIRKSATWQECLARKGVE